MSLAILLGFTLSCWHKSLSLWFLWRLAVLWCLTSGKYVDWCLSAVQDLHQWSSTWPARIDLVPYKNKQGIVYNVAHTASGTAQKRQQITVHQCLGTEHGNHQDSVCWNSPKHDVRGCIHCLRYVAQSVWSRTSKQKEVGFLQICPYHPCSLRGKLLSVIVINAVVVKVFFQKSKFLWAFTRQVTNQFIQQSIQKLQRESGRCWWPVLEYAIDEVE